MFYFFGRILEKFITVRFMRIIITSRLTRGKFRYLMAILSPTYWFLFLMQRLPMNSVRKHMLLKKQEES